MACAGCVILGGWGFFRTIRISKGIWAYQQGVTAYKRDDNSEAADKLRLARTFMPEEEAFEDLEAFYHGHVCLDEENPAEAARWFQVSLNLDPNSKETTFMLYVARRREAFQSGNYEEYFRTSESLLELEGRTTQALLGMASAWACRFVLTGKEEYRQQSLVCLKEARTARGADPDDWIIEGWVNKILEKRTIMSLLDFRYSIGRGGGEDKDFG